MKGNPGSTLASDFPSWAAAQEHGHDQAASCVADHVSWVTSHRGVHTVYGGRRRGKPKRMHGRIHSIEFSILAQCWMSGNLPCPFASCYLHLVWCMSEALC